MSAQLIEQEPVPMVRLGQTTQLDSLPSGPQPDARAGFDPTSTMPQMGLESTQILTLPEGVDTGAVQAGQVFHDVATLESMTGFRGEPSEPRTRRGAKVAGRAVLSRLGLGRGAQASEPEASVGERVDAQISDATFAAMGEARQARDLAATPVSLEDYRAGERRPGGATIVNTSGGRVTVYEATPANKSDRHGVVTGDEPLPGSNDVTPSWALRAGEVATTDATEPTSNIVDEARAAVATAHGDQAEGARSRGRGRHVRDANVHASPIPPAEIEAQARQELQDAQAAQAVPEQTPRRGRHAAAYDENYDRRSAEFNQDMDALYAETLGMPPARAGRHAATPIENEARAALQAQAEQNVAEIEPATLGERGNGIERIPTTTRLIQYLKQAHNSLKGAIDNPQTQADLNRVAVALGMAPQPFIDFGIRDRNPERGARLRQAAGKAGRMAVKVLAGAATIAVPPELLQAPEHQR